MKDRHLAGPDSWVGMPDHRESDKGLPIGLFTIEYPVRDETIVSRARVKSVAIERSARQSLHCREESVVKLQPPHSSFSAEEALNDEAENAPESPIVRKSLQTRSLIKTRWVLPSFLSASEHQRLCVCMCVCICMCVCTRTLVRGWGVGCRF